MGDRNAAREAYVEAREQSEESNRILELKLSDLGVGGDA